MQSALSVAWLTERYLASWVARAGALLFLLWGFYCLVFGIPNVDFWIPYRIDLDVYRLGAQVFRDGGDLYGRLPDTQIGANLPFTYPPIAAALFVPLTWLPLRPANVVFTLVTLLALVAVVWLVVREAFRMKWADAAWVAVALSSLLVWAIPVRETVEFGQVNVVLMALVVTDVVVGRGRWWQGCLIGLAMAVKLTPAVFLAYFLVRRDWRALAVGVGSALSYTGIGFLLAWGPSVQYWSETLSDPTRIGELEYVSNQSLNGLLHRLALGDPATTVTWFLVCAALGLSSLLLLRILFDRGNDAGAMVVMGMYSLLASPVSWAHHWVWVVPALLVLAAWGLRAGGAVRVLLVLVVVLGVAAFYGRGIWNVPSRGGLELQWTWWQQLLGNSYVLWGLLFFATAWLVALRAPRAVREGP